MKIKGDSKEKKEGVVFLFCHTNIIFEIGAVCHLGVVIVFRPREDGYFTIVSLTFTK